MKSSRADPGGSTGIVDSAAAAVRAGDPSGLVSTLESMSPADRRKVGRALLPSARAILDAPGEHRDSAHWDGALRDGHGDAATVIRLVAAAAATSAAKLHPVEERVSRDIIPLLFPDDLPVFVETWSSRYASRPKAWDANRGIEAIFDWAHQGLIAPPAQQGAVLALVTWAPVPTGPDLLAYLLRRPVLIRGTLPLLFQVAGVKGASAAQFDQTIIDPDGRGLRNFVIPELIARGHWSVEEVTRWCDDALHVPRSEYEYRWFRALRKDLTRSLS